MKKFYLSATPSQTRIFVFFSWTKTQLLLFFLILGFPLMMKAQWELHIPGFGNTITIADIYIVNENIIWAIGNTNTGTVLPNTYVVRSIDGGDTWTTGTVPFDVNPYITDLAAIDDMTAYTIGIDGVGPKTFKTEDGGVSWQYIDVGWNGANGSFPDYMHAFSADKICMIGDPVNGEYEIFNTNDGGLNWVKVNGTFIPNPQPGEWGLGNSGDAYGNHIWFGTNLNRVFYSFNGGNSWQVSAVLFDWISFCTFSDSLNGIISDRAYPASAGASDMYKTVDGGVNWTPITPWGGYYTPVGLEYIPNSTFIIMSTAGDDPVNGPYDTWVNPDRGAATWQQIMDDEDIGFLTFLDSNTGWASPISQLDHEWWLYKYTGSPLAGLLTADPVEAEVNISPNPTPNLVQLAVKTPQTNDFLVLLNDSEGKLLKSEKVNNTTDFQLSFDLKAYPAGVYSVTISTKAGHVSRSVVKQ
jgi:photosystem II stability/assembly factor-like uncharacterized protein